MFAERIAEALAGTQPIAIVGDAARDALYASAATWGFQLASVSATEIATFEESHPLCLNPSSGSWILMIEGAELVEAGLEDALLDLVFDGCASLPTGTLIAVHFSKYSDLSEALSDEDVPVTYLEMDTDELKAGLGAKTANLITRRMPADLTSIPLAA